MLEPISNNFFLSKDNLGFACVNKYNYNIDKFDIKKLKEEGVLDDYSIANIEKKRETYEYNPSPNYGPFVLEKLTNQDFAKCDSDQLLEQFQNYWSEEDWGEDLPAFKAVYAQANELLSKESMAEYEHFFLCMEWTDEHKKIEFNYWTWFVLVISIKPNTVITSIYGLD